MRLLTLFCLLYAKRTRSTIYFCGSAVCLPFFRPPSAASGAAQPPRPQGAGFRRKREPRGARERRKLVSSRVLKTSKKSKGYYSIMHNIIYCNSFLSFFNQHFPNTFYAGFNAQSQQRGFGGRVPRRGAGAEPLHQFTAKLLFTAAPAVLFRSIFVFYILRRLYLYGNICINKIISLCLNIMNFALFNTAKNSWRCIIRPPRQNYDSLAERCCRSIL